MLFLRALALVAAAAVLGLLGNAVRPQGVPLAGFESASVCEASHGGESPPALISPDEASALCGQSGAMIADARPAPVFAEGHIAGAIHLPCSASGAKATSGLDSLGHAGSVIVYGESTDDARPVAEALAKRVGGHGTRVLVLDGGFAAWNQAGLACASGPCNQCEEGHGH